MESTLRCRLLCISWSASFHASRCSTSNRCFVCVIMRTTHVQHFDSASTQSHLAAVKMPAKRESRRAGSTRGTAIAIDLDDSDSEGQTSTAQSTGRPARPSRTKAAPPRGPASSSKSRKGHSVGVKAPRDLSSDSDEFSDAIVVATSRTVKGKQAATTGRNGQTTASTRKHMDQQEHSKRSRSASSSIQAITKPQATSSIDRLPTPESLVTEESEPEPKRLLKADRTPVRRTAAQHEDNKSRSANTGGPSFLERLKSNATPQFSKSFKGKVRSSASGSIVSRTFLLYLS